MRDCNDERPSESHFVRFVELVQDQSDDLITFDEYLAIEDNEVMKKIPKYLLGNIGELISLLTLLSAVTAAVLNVLQLAGAKLQLVSSDVVTLTDGASAGIIVALFTCGCVFAERLICRYVSHYMELRQDRKLNYLDRDGIAFVLNSVLALLALCSITETVWRAMGGRISCFDTAVLAFFSTATVALQVWHAWLLRPARWRVNQSRLFWASLILLACLNLCFSSNVKLTLIRDYIVLSASFSYAIAWEACIGFRLHPHHLLVHFLNRLLFKEQTERRTLSQHACNRVKDLFRNLLVRIIACDLFILLLAN